MATNLTESGHPTTYPNAARPPVSEFSNRNIFHVDLWFDLDSALHEPEFPAKDSSRFLLPENPVSGMPTIYTVGVCAVCMEEFEAKIGAKRLPCCHFYHDRCISLWLGRDNSCPLCRCRIPAGH